MAEHQDHQEYTATFRTIPLFKDVAEADLRVLAEGARERRFQPKDLVVREGESGDELFVILEGQFQVFVRQEALDFEKELARLKAGDYFGEISVITGDKRLANVRALTAGRVAVVHQKQLYDLVNRSPGVGLALCRGLIDYLMQAKRHERAIHLVRLDDYPQLKDVHRLIPRRIAANCRAVAIERNADRVKVALVDPHDESLRAFINDVLRQYRVEFVAASERDFDHYRDLHLGKTEAPETPTPEDADADGDGGADGVGALSVVNRDGAEEPLGGNETADLLKKVLARAVRLGASDVHCEPAGEESRVRLRVDGRMLTLPDTVTSKLFGQLVSRVKVMSELDITERRMPQDGRLGLKAGQRPIEVRVSVTPCHGGEKLVMRVLDPAQRIADLDGVILSRPVALVVRDLFLEPSGLVLVCGPAGSGKTTTLYAGLHEVWKQSQAINVVTIEEPVEYKLDFATQIPVLRSAGLDFAQAMRTVLRQDPDVIMVGEIRDAESADMAMEAATTGRLVLSSLHTDFGLESVSRLRNLQVKSYLLASALRGVVSQKLVPRICKNCSEPVSADDEHVKALRRLEIVDDSFTTMPHRGRGCDVCRGQGEIGRSGVFEVLVVSDELRDLIEENATWAAMNEALTPDNFISMARYSRFLLKEGIVAPERIREIFPSKRIAEGVGL